MIKFAENLCLFMIVQLKNINESECGDDNARNYKSQLDILIVHTNTKTLRK